MAVHNAISTIGEAVQSGLSQSVDQIELLVCDDASNDGTGLALRTWSDPRLLLLKNDFNLGPGPSRDKAIQSASAPWIALLDADDAWHPDRLSRLLAAAESTGADVVFDDSLLCHDVGGRLVKWKRIHGTRAFGGEGTSARCVRIEDYIVADRLLIHPLIRTDFIRQHGIRHSSRRFAEDAEFYLRLSLAGAKFCYVPEPLYYYRITPGSLTAQAKDPTLMRTCLEEYAQWEGWWPSAREAFQIKSASLQANEALYQLAAAIRAGSFGKAAAVLISEPRLLAQLPHRLARQIHYQVHRLAHGASGR